MKREIELCAIKKTKADLHNYVQVLYTRPMVDFVALLYTQVRSCVCFSLSFRLISDNFDDLLFRIMDWISDDNFTLTTADETGESTSKIKYR